METPVTVDPFIRLTLSKNLEEKQIAGKAVLLRVSEIAYIYGRGTGSMVGLTGSSENFLVEEAPEVISLRHGIYVN